MDMALEKQYNKPAKGPSGIIGISRRKEAVCKWNLIRHDKLLYTSNLESLCNLIADDEYNLHHEFSPSAHKADKIAVDTLFEYFKDNINPFDSSHDKVTNFVTGEVIDPGLTEDLINCITIGEAAYSEFKSSHLDEKTVKLFDPIKRTNIVMKSVEFQKPPDINKETQVFMRTIDIARLRGYNLNLLLQHELTSTSFYLTKEGNLRKSEKSELLRELKNTLEEIPEVVPIDDIPTAIIFDFMAYCRKVPVKKLKLRTYEDLLNYLWSTFKNIASNTNRIDIVFDVYLETGIKQQERNRRGKKCQIVETKINSIRQNLPIELDKFWGSSDNKMQLQQIFITWLRDTYSGEKPVYLGGAIPDDITSCIKICGDHTSSQRLLKCFHEEADDRMLFHVNHAVRVKNFHKVIVASPDTDVFVNLVYHFTCWIYADLEQLWMISGKKGSQTAVPIHLLKEKLDNNIVDILPVVHALTG